MEIKRWDYLRSVLAVSRTGSIRLAAEETGQSRVTIGRHIEHLNEIDFAYQLPEQFVSFVRIEQIMNVKRVTSTQLARI